MLATPSLYLEQQFNEKQITVEGYKNIEVP